MPYRWSLPTPAEPLDPDRFGDFHDDRAAMRESLLRGGGDEVPSICPTCFKDIEAREWCDRCGEDDEAAA